MIFRTGCIAGIIFGKFSTFSLVFTLALRFGRVWFFEDWSR